MMRIRITFVSILGAAMTLSSAVSTQGKVTVDGNIGSVNNYVWRGMDRNSGFSVQPSLGPSHKGLSLSARCSQSLTNNADRDVQELDISLSYSIGGLSITLTDYWWSGLRNPYGYYEQGPIDSPIDGGHHLEVTVAYNLSTKLSLTLSWSTWFAGADMRTDSDKRCCSTYTSASYDIACPAEMTLMPSIGFTPRKGYYNGKAAITDVSLKASKSFGISGKFSIPLFVQAVVLLANDHVYLAAGAGIGF